MTCSLCKTELVQTDLGFTLLSTFTCPKDGMIVYVGGGARHD